MGNSFLPVTGTGALKDLKKQLQHRRKRGYFGDDEFLKEVKKELRKRR